MVSQISECRQLEQQFNTLNAYCKIQASQKAVQLDISEQCTCSDRIGSNMLKCWGEKCSTHQIQYECDPRHHDCDNQNIQKGINAQIELRKTRDKGVGLFALQQFQKDDYITHFSGEYFLERGRKWKNRFISYLQSDDDEFGNYNLRISQVGRNGKEVFFIIDPQFQGSLGRFANHSCSPNADYHQLGLPNGFPGLALIAKRPILSGEEITADYQYDPTNTQQFRCACGSEHCRKNIGLLKEKDKSAIIASFKKNIQFSLPPRVAQRRAANMEKCKKGEERAKVRQARQQSMLRADCTRKKKKQALKEQQLIENLSKQTFTCI